MFMYSSLALRAYWMHPPSPCLPLGSWRSGSSHHLTESQPTSHGGPIWNRGPLWSEQMTDSSPSVE